MVYGQGSIPERMGEQTDREDNSGHTNSNNVLQKFVKIDFYNRYTKIKYEKIKN